MSQVAKTRILWLMGWNSVSQAGLVSAWRDADAASTGDTRVGDARPRIGRFALLLASFRPRSHGRRLRMVTHIGSQNPEDDVFGNVGGVVGDAFQIARHQQRI